MRIEYNTNASMSILKSSIKDFMSNFPTLYTLTYDNGTNIVYHVEKYDIDLVFTEEYKAGKNLLVCFLVKEFPSVYATTNDWFIHADNIPLWVGDPVQYDIYNEHPSLVRRVALPIYYPCFYLLPANKLIANYNSKNDTIMLSTIQILTLNLSGLDSMPLKVATSNLIISDSEKYLDFDGGFFIAGTYGGCMEFVVKRSLRCERSDNPPMHRHWWESAGTLLYFIADSHANCAYFHVQPRPRCHTGTWYYPWVDDPYQMYNNRVRSDTQDISRNMPNINNYNDFDIIMYGKIDNAPYRNRGTLAHQLSFLEKTPSFPSYCYDGLAGPAYVSSGDIGNIKIDRYADWCLSFQPSPKLYDTVTTGSEGHLPYFYPIAVPSITNSTIKVPRYEPLLSSSMLDNGHNVNTLNDISMVMPLYIMVRRDPSEDELSYSAVCRNDVINFVNMRYMSTDKITNGIYPVDEHTYNCFNTSIRRSIAGFKGYQGIAFRQEDEE